VAVAGLGLKGGLHPPSSPAKRAANMQKKVRSGDEARWRAFQCHN